MTTQKIEDSLISSDYTYNPDSIGKLLTVKDVASFWQMKPCTVLRAIKANPDVPVFGRGTNQLRIPYAYLGLLTERHFNV